MYERKNTGIWLMYLRKSRQDNPEETVEEVLAKHEIQLQEHAVRELGGRIAEENIYREVVSGESIADREEIKKVLARIEDPSVAGVLVIEPQRLSRGDLEDCGQLINTFRFTHTQICTLIMTYDLEDKMDRKFFQDELLRGRDYLEYTKEILFRGRLAAVKRGCYISAIPPLGYDRIKIGKDHTLVPNSDAELVRAIFDWYTQEGLSYGAITKRLKKMNPSTSRPTKWPLEVIREMLINVHYIGKVAYNQNKSTPVLENGQVVIKHLKQKKDTVIIAEGKHPAIIDLETWEAAQKRIANNRRIIDLPLQNPLSGILRCSCCGRVLQPNSSKRYICRTVPRCFKTVKQRVVVEAVLNTLEFSELPRLVDLAKNGDGGETKRLQHLVTKLEKQMQEYRAQEDKQYEMLETGCYTLDVFTHRHLALQEKIDLCQKQISETKEKIPKNVNYSEQVDTLKKAIELLKDPTATPEEQNTLLKRIVKTISFTGEKNDGKRSSPNSENSFSIEITLVI